MKIEPSVIGGQPLFFLVYSVCITEALHNFLPFMSPPLLFLFIQWSTYIQHLSLNTIDIPVHVILREYCRLGGWEFSECYNAA